MGQSRQRLANFTSFSVVTLLPGYSELLASNNIILSIIFGHKAAFREKLWKLAAVFAKMPPLV